jgi:hypothetical protein
LSVVGEPRSSSGFFGRDRDGVAVRNGSLNKVIHVPPDTFNLIRTNTLLLEDIKTCTSCRIFIAEATQVGAALPRVARPLSIGPGPY